MKHGKKSLSRNCKKSPPVKLSVKYSHSDLNCQSDYISELIAVLTHEYFKNKFTKVNIDIFARFLVNGSISIERNKMCH